MKIEVNSISGKKYDSRKIIEGEKTEHVGQDYYAGGYGNLDEWKRRFYVSLVGKPGISNIKEFDKRFEWDYTYIQRFVEIETLKDLLQFSKEVGYDLIVSSEDNIIRIYDGRDE